MRAISTEGVGVVECGNAMECNGHTHLQRRQILWVHLQHIVVHCLINGSLHNEARGQLHSVKGRQEAAMQQGVPRFSTATLTPPALQRVLQPP